MELVPFYVSVNSVKLDTISRTELFRDPLEQGISR